MGWDNGTRPARIRLGSGVRYPTGRLWALIASILFTIGGIALLTFSIAADSDYYGSNSTHNTDYSDPPHTPWVALSIFLGGINQSWRHMTCQQIVEHFNRLTPAQRLSRPPI